MVAQEVEQSVLHNMNAIMDETSGETEPKSAGKTKSNGDASHRAKEYQSKLKELREARERMAGKLASLDTRIAEYKQASPETKRKQHNDEDPEAAKQRQAEAAELVQKLQAEKREREARLHKRLSHILTQADQEEEQERVQKAREKEAAAKKRAEEALALYKVQKEKRKDAQGKMQELAQESRIVPEDEYLYKKLEQRYEKEVLLPMLESKKQALAQKRSTVQPLSHEAMQEHLRKYQELISSRDKAKAQKYRQLLREERNIRLRQKQLQTSFSEQTQQLERATKERAEKLKGEKQVRREKMTKYARLVKELRTVTISEEKAAELKQQIEQLKHPVRQPRDVKDQYAIAKVLHHRTAIRVSHPSVEAVTNRSLDSGSISSLQPEHRRYSRDGRVKVALKLALHGSTSVTATATKSGPRTSIQKSVLTSSTEEGHKKPNYLAELRQNRNGSGNSGSLGCDWAADMRNQSLSEADKYERVVAKAHFIEEQARMKEQVLRVQGGPTKNFEMGTRVSDLLVDAIKAKLAVLQQI